MAWQWQGMQIIHLWSDPWLPINQIKSYLEPVLPPESLFVRVVCFCLRSSAKDQWITWVVLLVVLVLHLLVNFLIKRNLREKILPYQHSNLGLPDPQSGTLPTKLRRHCYDNVWTLSTYFKDHYADLGPVLVDICFIYMSMIDYFNKDFVWRPGGLF